MGEPVIDQAVFRELQQSAGTEFVADLVRTFLEDGIDLLRQLEDAVRTRDAERFRRAAHSLKSNGGTFGAMRLASLARGYELGGLTSVDAEGQDLRQLRLAYDEAARELGMLSSGR